MVSEKNKLSIYIHWPFCKKKCPYCDFNSHVSNDVNHDRWLKAYLQEIEYFKEFIGKKQINSIFFGGGTPSLMDPQSIEKIIDKINQISAFENIEITLEANPTSIEAQKFKDFKNAGINRVSIGIQSLNDDALKFLGREHSSSEAIGAVKVAASVFDNYSIDLIYARPEQTLQEWKTELNQALQYAKNHISLYQLTIEKGTDFYAQHRDGAFTMPEQERALELYEATNEALAIQGFDRYEISNYAKPGFESQHNLSYWRYIEYLGVGPGAHSRVQLNGEKLSSMVMLHNPEKWLGHVEKSQHGIQQLNALTIEEVASEYVLMGTRLEEGLSLSNFTSRFGRDLNDFLDGDRLDFFAKNNLLMYDNNKLKLTNKGKTLLNYISAQILKV